MGPIKIKTLLIKSYFNSSLIPVYGQREILRLLRKQTEERGERKQEEEGVSSGMIITYFTDEGWLTSDDSNILRLFNLFFFTSSFEPDSFKATGVFYSRLPAFTFGPTDETLQQSVNRCRNLKTRSISCILLVQQKTFLFFKTPCDTCCKVHS